MSNFGELIRRLRKDRGLTLADVAQAIGSNKGYVSGIETDKVNPPSPKLVRKLAKLFREDERKLLWIAWADKAPAIIRREVQGLATFPTASSGAGEDHRVPLVNAKGTGYPLHLNDRGHIQPLVHAYLQLPARLVKGVDVALIIQEGSMADSGRSGLHPGDVALLRHEEAIRGGADAFVILEGVGSMVRHVELEAGGRVALEPRHPNHPRKVVRKSDVKAFYPVVGRVHYLDA